MYVSFETNIRISNFVFEYLNIRLSPNISLLCAYKLAIATVRTSFTFPLQVEAIGPAFRVS